MKPSRFNFSESTHKPQRTFLVSLIKHASFNDKSGKILLLSTLVFSYIQLLSQSMHLVFKYIPNDDNNISTTTHLMERISSFDDIFSYGENDGILLLTCCGIVLYFILLLVSFLTIWFCASKSRKPHYAIAHITPLLLQIHVLVLFWPIRNLLNRLQSESRTNNLSKIYVNLGNNTIFVSSITLTVINIAFAVVPTFWLFHILPTQNPASSRNYYIDQVSLVQKGILSFLVESLSILSETPEVLVIANLLFSLLRLAWYMYAFPRYRITTFKIELYLINITTMLPLLTLIIYIANKASDTPVTTTRVIIVFIILSVLTVISTKLRFTAILKRVVFLSTKTLGPYKALYKLLFLKYLASKVTSINELGAKFDYIYLCFSTANNCASQVFEECRLSKNSVNLSTKAGISQLKRNYLEYLVSYFPKHDDFKLMLADVYAKNFGLYALAIKFLTKIKYSYSSFHVKVSAELLNLKIQELIMKAEHNKDAKINLSEYIAIKNEQKSLQNEIKKQFDLHNKFWREYSHNNANLFELQILSRKIEKQKLSIKKQWSRIESKQSKNLSLLCLLYGKYQIILNNSLENGLKYLQKHNLLYKPSDPTLPLNTSNFFDINNFCVIVTTSQEKMGSIIHASESIQKALGYQKELLIGSNIGSLMSPYLSESHNSFISEYTRTGKRSFTGQSQSVLIKDASGALRKASLFVDIYPSLKQEICLIGLFRVLEDPFEYIIITPDGEIDSCTAGIGLQLGLQRKNVQIENICCDFEEVIGHRKVKIVDNSKELQKQSEAKGSQEDIEGIPQDLLLSPERHFLSNKPNPCALLLSEGNGFLSQEGKIDQKEQKNENFSPGNVHKKLKMTFNTCNLMSTKLTETFTYECEIDTILFKDGYLRVLAIEMIDKNRRKEPDSIENMGSTEKKHELANKNKEVSPISPANFIKLTSFPRKNNDKKISLVQHFEPAKDLPDKIMSSQMSNSSTSHGNQRRSTHMEGALNIKYYPKQIFTFVAASIVLICAHLIIEGLFHQNTETAMNKIKALTKTMELANSRADSFSALARNTRAAYYIRENFLPAGLSVTNNTNSSLYSALGLYLPRLASSNSQLQLAIQDVDSTFRESFTATNIRMYDVNPDLTLSAPRYFDTFMATNVLVENVLTLRNTYLTTFPLYEFHKIFQNTVNDLLVSTVDAVEIIYNEIQISSNKIESTLQVYQIISICLIAARLFLSCWFFYWAYYSEVTLGQKFLLIMPKQVEMIQQRLHNFGKSLEKEDLEQLSRLDIEELTSFAKVANVRVDKNPRTSGVIRQYWKRILVYLILLALLVSLVNFAFFYVKEKFKNLNQKIDSLAQVESMQYEIAILSFTIAQIVCNDFLTTVRNRAPEVELQADLDHLKLTIDTLMQVFTEDDGTINPIVAPFFFGDICQLVTSAQLSNCLGITKGSKEFGLFSLLSRHHTLINNLYIEFQLSNQTFPALQNLVILSVSTQVPSLNVIKDLLQTIMDLLSADLDEEWTLMYRDIRLVITVNTCSLLIFWMLVSRFVHLFFFDFYNRLKRMLKVVPHDILLGNATLKGVLLISSRKKLNKIKNYM